MGYGRLRPALSIELNGSLSFCLSERRIISTPYQSLNDLAAIDHA